jgi:hypothetical protein
MSRDVQQRQRTQDNPLNLGSFSRTSLRYLKGNLGPVYKPVGRSDTRSTSNGGIGGGSYNHWFKITLLTDAWIIVAKGPPRPQYIQVSAYDLNQNPIQERGIFDADSIRSQQNGTVYYPYVGQVMGAQSDLYNNFNPGRLDKGNDTYFPLSAGSYLLCVSTTRNEPLDYAVGLVVEVEDLEQAYLLETGGLDFLIYENAIATNNTEVIGPSFSSDFVIDPGINAYSNETVTIFAGATVTVSAGSTWFIDNNTVTAEQGRIFFDTTPSYTGASEHLHSLSEWQQAWEREHQQDDRFPDVFIPLVTTT